MDTGSWVERVRCMETETRKLTSPCGKQDSQWGLAVRLTELKQGPCVSLEGRAGEGGEMGREAAGRLKREGTQV